MKYLKNISTQIQRFAIRKYMILLFVMLVVILTLMEIGPVGKAKLSEVSGGLGMLDMQFGYSPHQAFNMIRTLGIDGRHLYSKLLGLDFIFIIIFALLQSLLFSSLHKSAQLNDTWQWINLIPFIRALFDFLENTLILLMLMRYPEKPVVIAEISSEVTVLKWIIYYLIIAIAFSLGSLASRRSIVSIIEKRRNMKTIGKTNALEMRNTI